MNRTTGPPRGPLAGLVAAFDAEAARCRDRRAPQSHAAHPGCDGGLMRECAAKGGRGDPPVRHRAGMRNACPDHNQPGTVATLAMAADLAAVIVLPPPVLAEAIAGLRADEPLCCGAAGYARYLMMAAWRAGARLGEVPPG